MGSHGNMSYISMVCYSLQRNTVTVVKGKSLQRYEIEASFVFKNKN